MVKRYLGGVISSNQITPNSQLATGFFNTTEQLILKNKKLWELVPSWDLFRARYNSTGKLGQFSVAAQEIGANSFFFKSDGTRLYVIGDTGDDVNQYELSIAWDITTATYTKIFSIGTEETGPSALFFSPDGIKMYVMGITGDDVNEYTLSTAWDVATAVYTRLFSIATQETAPSGLFFREDGLKMYVTGSANDKIHEYTLSTAWNVTTAVFSRSFFVGTQEVVPHGLFFKPDGNTMYIVGQNTRAVYAYDLS